MTTTRQERNHGDTLTYAATGLPPGFALTASNGLIAGTPVLVGAYPVTATVSDGTLTTSQTFTWTVAPNASVTTGTIRLMWDANVEPVAGHFVHAGTQPGVYVQRYDAGLATTYLFSNAVIGQRYCFAVSAYVAGPTEGPKSAEVCGYANSAPTLTAVASSITLSGVASENVAVTLVSWSSDRGVSGTASGTSSWTATVTLASGTNVITVTVRDAAGNTAVDVVTVTRTNVAPTLANVPNQSSRVGRYDTYRLSGSDADGNVLTYSATGLPAGLTVNTSTGLISGTPTTVGTYTVTARVFDGQLSGTRTFTWTVRNERN